MTPLQGNPLVLFGAGGHGKVVLDAALSAGLTVAWVVDDQPDIDLLLGVPVIATSSREWRELRSFRFVAAIGQNATRARVFCGNKDRGGHRVRQGQLL